MFTGIIETLGTLKEIQKEGSNMHLTFESNFTDQLKIDQSLAHNGVCLTVVAIKDNTYTVTAIEETLQKTNIGSLQKGDKINLERALLASQRLDGHFVQGHVDLVAKCISIENKDGSWVYSFEYTPLNEEHTTVQKGSICINGVSLTVVDSEIGKFSVAIIPYTYENTNFHTLKIGNLVNLEFDILGKYIIKMLKNRQQ
jgi:riboflavin synthase